MNRYSVPLFPPSQTVTTSNGTTTVITMTITAANGSPEDSVTVNTASSPDAAGQLMALGGAIAGVGGFATTVASLVPGAGDSIGSGTAADATMIYGEGEAVGAIADGLEGVELALALGAGATGIGLAILLLGTAYYFYEQSQIPQ